MLIETLRVLAEGTVCNFIEYLLFEYDLPNGIKITLSSGQTECTCTLFPKDKLLEFIHPLDMIKNEGGYQDESQNAHFQITDSLFIKCKTRGEHHNDVIVTFTRYERPAAKWLFHVVNSGALHGC